MSGSFNAYFAIGLNFSNINIAESVVFYRTHLLILKMYSFKNDWNALDIWLNPLLTSCLKSSTFSSILSAKFLNPSVMLIYIIK